jgi:Cu(I)/Ag(I) efflux system membrane fusion protein
MNMNRYPAGKILLPLVISLIIGFTAGLLINRYTALGGHTGPGTGDGQQGEEEILYWVAPMDPDYRRDGPGKSPMGMDLVPVYAEESGQGADQEGAVRISPIVEHNLGVRTSRAERRSLWRKVEATGYVGFDESRLSQINVRTEGWVQRLLIEAEGERVSKGQLLFEFYSPQLVNAQKEFVQAKRRNDSRLQEGAENKLLALGMTRQDLQRLDDSGQVSESISVLAPQDGIVTRLNVQEGTYIRPATEILSLADLSSVWLQAGVFESQAEWVTKGQSAEARLNYMPGEVFSGRVEYVYPVLDPVTRTLQARLRFDNPGERMKPNMYARVTIFGKSHPGALSIPREALIRGAQFDRVVVSLGDGTYVVREVISGIESGQWVEIKSGIEPGDEVVTSSQFLLDSEASMGGSIQRLDSSGMMGRATDGGLVYGNGIVKAVDPASGRIRISHGPIEDLGWSAMTMEFDVMPGTGLENTRVGQNVRFSLYPTDVGDYVIGMVHHVDTTSRSGEEDTAAKDMDHPETTMDHSMHDTGTGDPQAHQANVKTEEPETKAIFAAGTVRDVDHQGHRIRVSHEPIEALGWPAMTMYLGVAKDVSLDGLGADENIHFSLIRDESGDYVIGMIHRMGRSK